jgi:hypothetical protein
VGEEQPPMATNRQQRSSAWFMLSLVVAIYIMISVGLAVATSDDCDVAGVPDGRKTWQPFPPHWECG